MSFVLPPGHFYHDDYNELLDYFRYAFNLGWCNSNDDKADKDRNRDDAPYANDPDFDQRTFIYTYQSIGLTVQGIHRPYIARILHHTADQGPVKVIDIGSGGGQTGLALHTLGFDVSFADIYSESAKFLAWRLYQRRLNRPIYLLNLSDTEIPFHDVVTCFDVMEHLNPAVQLDTIDKCASVGNNVFMNLIRTDLGGGGIKNVHKNVSVEQLTDYIYSKWPSMSYEDFYPNDDGIYRQRLVVYGSGVKRIEKRR